MRNSAQRWNYSTVSALTPAPCVPSFLKLFRHSSKDAAKYDRVTITRAKFITPLRDPRNNPSVLNALAQKHGSDCYSLEATAVRLADSAKIASATILFERTEADQPPLSSNQNTDVGS